MRTLAPSPLLAPYVEEFMISEFDETTTRVRLPEPGVVLGLRYGGSASWVTGDAFDQLPAATLTGVGSTARRMRTSAGGAVALARFRPGGAARFFAEPMHVLFGATWSLDQLIPRTTVERARSRVAEAKTDAGKVAAFEDFLSQRRKRSEPDGLVEEALRRITAARGAVKIRALARALGTSQDPLEKRFRREVGCSPKQFASLLRARHVIDAYRPGARLSEIALQAGYFDQSHFSREIRAMTGEPPARFFRGGAR